jgi:Cytidylate kinase-like family
LPYRVICISRVTGSHGDEVGLLVAEKLGLRYVDDEIIVQAAKKGGVDPADVADAQRRKSLLRRVLDDLGSGLGAEASALSHSPPELRDDNLQRLVVDVVEELAAQGDVVIAAHGASFVLAGRPDVLRVHVTASLEARSQRLSEASGLDHNAAVKSIRDSDRSRADYLRRFYGIESEQPTHYDVVLNTDRLKTGDVTELVVQAGTLTS